MGIMQAKKDPKIKLNLGPTQEAFVFSDALINTIDSSMGEGKTFAAVAAMVYHAKRNGKPIRCAIIRDTHENIKISTARSIKEILGRLAEFKNDFRELTIYSKPQVTVDLFGIDDPASLSKLQGSEFALIWLEEPAPMSDRSNAGLSEEVFSAALARCTRQSGCIPRLQITMNPADEEHWTYRRLITAPARDPDNPLVTNAVFHIPTGENHYLSERTRQSQRVAFQYNPALWTRYVEGKFAKVYRGKKVTTEYNPTIHLSKGPLEPHVGLVGFRCYDGWHDPACILGQITETGRIVILDALVGPDTDIRILIRTRIKPLLYSPRWKDRCRAWRDMGDVSMKTPDQSNINESAAKVVEEAFGSRFEGGPKQWETTERRMNDALTMLIKGAPAVIINPECSILHRALDGGWHYKIDQSGHRTKDVPEKDEFSHIGDCFANVTAILLPSEQRKTDPAKLERFKLKMKTRASSYVYQPT